MAVFREGGSVVIITPNGVRKCFLASCILGGYTTSSQTFLWLKGSSEDWYVSYHGSTEGATVKAVMEMREILKIANEINCEQEQRSLK